jgi:hypothetical protein
VYKILDFLKDRDHLGRLGTGCRIILQRVSLSLAQKYRSDVNIAGFRPKLSRMVHFVSNTCRDLFLDNINMPLV